MTTGDRIFRAHFKTDAGDEITRTVIGADSRAVLPQVTSLGFLIPAQVVRIEDTGEAEK